MVWVTKKLGERYSWYAQVRDIDGRLIWLAEVTQLCEGIFTLEIRPLGFSSGDWTYHDSAEKAKEAFEKFIHDTAVMMLGEVGKVE